LIATLTFAYVLALTPGHALIADDYAAYILHASNLVEGRPYAEIKYIVNPQAIWIGPVEGYPPVFPALLAPVYKLFGMNFWAMKIVTVLCFTIFLIVLVRLAEPILPLWGRIALILLVGLHPVFREYGNYVMSEIPYAMFSFAALWTIDVSYRDLRANDWHLREALLTAALIYLSYGTRTIGATLLPALALADLCRFKRPSRFLLVVLFTAGVLIGLQVSLLTAPKTYVRLTGFSAAGVHRNFLFYGKVLSYVWANGWSKKIQIVVAALATCIAAAGFLRIFRQRKSATEFYLLAYVVTLLFYTFEFGLRALLPILPLYFLYFLAGSARLAGRFRAPARAALVTSLAFGVAFTYIGSFQTGWRIKTGPDIRDAPFRQLCAFIKQSTAPSDVVAFDKPRSITLFTNRRSTALAGDETPAQLSRFVNEAHIAILVIPDWQPPYLDQFAVTHGKLIYRNAEYTVFQISGTY